MKHGKTTHNVYVNEKEYTRLGKDYPTGKYVKTETMSWFTLEIIQPSALETTSVIEIIFWRTE